MVSLLFISPAIAWFFALGIFLKILSKEEPEAYQELNFFKALRKDGEDDAAKTLAFFWYQKHQTLGSKVALAGKALNVVFILCVIAMFVIFWFGWTGRIDA